MRKQVTYLHNIDCRIFYRSSIIADTLVLCLIYKFSCVMTMCIGLGVCLISGVHCKPWIRGTELLLKHCTILFSLPIYASNCVPYASNWR